MAKGNRFCVAALLILSLGSALSGATVVSLIGDKDGFGLGILPNQEFDYAAVGSGDGDGTDVWRFGTQSWTHNYSLAGIGGAPTSASIEIFHGGDQTVGGVTPSLLLNGTVVGTLTPPGGNSAMLDVIDLTPFVALLTGSDEVQFTLANGDGWVLDYSELTVADSAVPEPAPALLLAAGLGSIILIGRRRRTSSAK